MKVNLRTSRGEAPNAVNARAHQGASLPELAGRPLFEPLASLLRAMPRPGPPEALNALCREGVRCPIAPGPIRLVAPDADRTPYEERIVTRGEVVTRAHDWHDFFNALVWMRFPRAKFELAKLHAAGIRAGHGKTGRGPLRDAATQFDESGIVVAATDPRLLALLAERQWRPLFCDRRDAVREQMRFVVFGHGLYDALRAPFHGLCGRAVTVVVSQALIDRPVERLWAHLDAVLAERFALRTWYPRPKALLPLPLLGIPGVCAGNESPEYYDDAVQFRPLPANPSP